MLQPEATLISMGYAANEAILMGVAHAVNLGHDDAQVLAPAKHHVWIYGPAVARVCVDVCCPGYH